MINNFLYSSKCNTLGEKGMNQMVNLLDYDEETKDTIRRAIGFSIDADTAEISIRSRHSDDPYADISAECETGCEEQFWFARTPGTTPWIWFNHLPIETVTKLWMSCVKDGVIESRANYFNTLHC